MEDTKTNKAGCTHPIFVYGTLMRGQRAAHMLDDCVFGGCFRLKDYGMYHLGSYPGIYPCEGESVLGELYYVDDKILARMDEYEGEGSLYLRTPVQITAGGKTADAEVYVYNYSFSGCRLMRECWNATDEDLVWYAAYGSNLSSERFACYISGGICKENGRNYSGCSDPTPPRAVQKQRYPGSLYFGNSSSTWSGGGVAFFDPLSKEDFVYMKLYLISRHQLHEVMAQEGASPNWYGRLLCLDLDENGVPVYTLTSESRRPANTPSPAYKDLIAKALCKEFGLTIGEAIRYLNQRI